MTGQNFNRLTPMTQGIIILSGFVAVGTIGFFVYKAHKKNQSLIGSKNELDTTKNEAKVLNSNPATKAKLSPAQQALFANSLFTAMDGYGTDLPAIYKVFANMNNDADVLGLIDAFGIREISSGSLNPEPNYKGALGGAITSEAGNDAVKAINMGLAKKGIKYRF